MTAKDKCSTKKQHRAKSRATKSRKKETSVIETSSSDEAQESDLGFFLKKSLRLLTITTTKKKNNTKRGMCNTHIFAPGASGITHISNLGGQRGCPELCM